MGTTVNAQYNLAIQGMSQLSRTGTCSSCGRAGSMGQTVCAHCGQAIYAKESEQNQLSLSLVQKNELEGKSQDASPKKDNTPPTDLNELTGSHKTDQYAVQLAAETSGTPGTLSSSPARNVQASTVENTTSGEKTDTSELSLDEMAALNELQQRDREVRAHEQAHISASNGYASGASYTYQTGPDGKQYAVGGEVSIDTSPVPGDPEATEEKAQTIRRAALAPASPSAQDQKVASQASQMEAEARTEKIKEEREEEKEEEKEKGEETDSKTANSPESSNTEQTLKEELNELPASPHTRTIQAYERAGALQNPSHAQQEQRNALYFDSYL